MNIHRVSAVSSLRDVQYTLVSSMPSGPEGAAPGETLTLNASESRRALSAFLLFGILTSVLGALLPVWGYHLESDLTTAGNLFLCLNAGFLIAAAAAHKLLARHGIAFSLAVSSLLACAAFLILAWMPASSPLVESTGMLLIGLSAGLLHAVVFHAISPLYLHDRAATVTLAGTVYGLGCFLTVLLVAGTYYVYSVRGILIVFASIPAIYVPIFALGRFRNAAIAPNLSFRSVIDEFKNPGAVLFTLILFFQFGNEWAIAGWLPIFLIRRLGISPEGALLMLAFYWGSLMVGRVCAKALMKSVGHAKLLLVSIVLALSGCIILMYTPNRFGANTGILFLGAGFASIYPLVVERIGHRFTYYHPGFYNGIFSFAITGGLLAPFVLGYLSQWFGVSAIMVVPMLGTFMVFLLVLLMVLESKLSGEFGVRRAGA